jgi:GntR family transcriptional regulator, arabinose operon transcriptional repressor
MISTAEKLANELRDAITSGKYSLGDRLPAERALVDIYDTNRRTVRGALEILQQERLIVRKQGRGAFVANPAHVKVDEHEVKLIAIMVYEREYYFEPIIKAASNEAALRGFTLATGTNTTFELEQQHVDAFIANDIRGVIMTPRRQTGFPNYQKLIDKGIKVIFLDNLFEEHYEDNIQVDNYFGIRLAVEHLAKMGHKKIAYIGSNEILDYPIGLQRMCGFKDACQEFEIQLNHSWILKRAQNKLAAKLAEILKKKNRPTAFVCYNDRWANEFIECANDLGLNIPGDISVVGFDDSREAAFGPVPLTTLNPEYGETGAIAVDFLLSKLQNASPRPKQSISIMPRLVIRESTASVV